MRKHLKKALLAALALVFVATWSSAKNIDLVTLPDRDTVQLTIYNSEDITFVKETRYLSLKKGANPLQFSWAGTLIDPTSVEFRPLDHASEIEVADTIFPGDKPQHLIWNVESEYEGQVRVEVSYFTSGLTWDMDYVAVTDPKEENLAFRGYVRVYNNSGEEYENAQVRLIVGTINLVEKIATLAQRQGRPVPAPSAPVYQEMKSRAVMESFDKAEEVMMAGRMQAQAAPKEIVKEGLSEYFMFSIDGYETIKNGWSKRLKAVEADGVKFDIVYRMREFQYGPRPVRFFIWNNDQEHKLGGSPLPDGRVRIFRENEKQGLSFLGEQKVTYVPVKADLEINLGPDDLVVYESKKMSTERNHFSFNKDDHVNGWNEEQKWNDVVKNYRDKPIVFELRRQWDGDVEYESKLETTAFDYRTTETVIKVKGRSKTEHPVTVVVRFGENKKQDRVEID